jgi:hypothetical protein
MRGLMRWVRELIGGGTAPAGGATDRRADAAPLASGAAAPAGAEVTLIVPGMT